MYQQRVPDPGHHPTGFGDLPRTFRILCDALHTLIAKQKSARSMSLTYSEEIQNPSR